ncbi:MAG: hypothetical protein AABZ06_00190 [Bdellovibrionota bacterium]|jgi:hypothetical protein
MLEKDEVRNDKKTGRAKPAQEKDEHKSARKKCDWKGVFEDVTYSSGPGDNIFVFG